LFTSSTDKIGERMEKMRKNVLVTGCSAGGLGFALAKAFRNQGFHVLAAVRDANKAGSLAEEKDIEILTLDVTSAASIATCLEYVRSTTGGKLDILVNNAGVAIFGPLIHASIEEGKAAYDVNVWAPLAVAQAFSPLLIESKGVILNIASIAGAVPLAWQGTYPSVHFTSLYLNPISSF
jgi:1-acylglycerone phosphate reductase